MQTKNFTQKELETYFNNKEIYFFNFRSCHILKHDKNKGFYFVKDKTRSKNLGLPHTKKGRFFAFKLLDSYTVLSGETPPEKILIDKLINSKIINNNLKAIDLVIKLKRYGFESKKETQKTALKDLSFKGKFLKNVFIQGEYINLKY